MTPARTLEQLKEIVEKKGFHAMGQMTNEEYSAWIAYCNTWTPPTKEELEKDSIHEILEERGSRYGPFAGHARITQSLKQGMRYMTNWGSLTDSQQEALEMIVHKIGRILNGDPNYLDSWVDIAGYTQLVIDELTAN